MTTPPIAYPDILMTDKYANSADERGKKIDAPKSLVGIGAVDLSLSSSGLHAFSALPHAPVG
jgi:hypothetical protein